MNSKNRKVRYKQLGLTINPPLSLVLRDLLQTYPPHLLELGLIQRLGEYVCKLISSGDVVGLNAPVLQAVPDEVLLDPDVFAPVMEDRILGQS